jgi:hypothetical protein
MFETVQYDNKYTELNANFTIDGNLTIGPYNNRVVFFILTANNVSITVSSLTFAGQPLTTAVERYTNSHTHIIAYQINPPVGTHTIYGEFSAAVPHVATAISFYNVKNIDTLSTTRSVGVTSGDYTGAITVPDFGLFIDSISTEQNLFPGQLEPQAGQTVIDRFVSTQGSCAQGYRIFTNDAGSYTSSWNNSTAFTTTYVEAAFNPATKQGGSFLYNLI